MARSTGVGAHRQAAGARDRNTRLIEQDQLGDQGASVGAYQILAGSDSIG
jgi:hypothetical protein